MRTCEGLVDSLLYVIKACVNTSDFDSKVHTRARRHLHRHTLSLGENRQTHDKRLWGKILLSVFESFSAGV